MSSGKIKINISILIREYFKTGLDKANILL